MKPYQIDLFPFSMLGDLEEIDNPEESRLTCQLRSDIRESNYLDRIHLDFTLIHAISTSHTDA
jgi:hypothetical protein